MAYKDSQVMLVIGIAILLYLWYNCSGQVKNSGTVQLDETPFEIHEEQPHIVPSITGGHINLSEFDLAAYNPGPNLPKGPPGTWDANSLLPDGTQEFDGIDLLAPIDQAGVWVDAMRNANHQIRNDPPIKKFNVGPWQNTTINPDLWRKPIDV